MSEFLSMGGYAVYVWSSMALGFLILILNIVLPMAAHRTALKKAEDFHAGKIIDGEHS